MKRHSYVQESFDVLQAHGYTVGDELTRADLTDKLGRRLEEDEELQRFSAALSALVAHGVLERVGWAESETGGNRKLRVYEVVLPLDDEHRPTQSARRLGSKRARHRRVVEKATSDVQGAFDEADALSQDDRLSDIAELQSKLEAVEVAAALLGETIADLRGAIDEKALDAAGGGNE